MNNALTRRFLLGGASAFAIVVGSALDAATFDFSFTGSIETATVVETGTYRVTMRAADGGVSELTSGGFGASAMGDIFLNAGTTFSALVGGVGENGYYAGGGGGMSFFRAGSNLAVAGGGGGAYRGTYGGQTNMNGGATASVGGANANSAYLGGAAGSVGSTGGGGTAVGGGGGAGIDQNGGGSGYATGGSTGPSFTGGSGYAISGGFGGGGGGADGTYAQGGGGGGGFFGGGGGNFGEGGGGSSYFSTLFTNTSLFENSDFANAFVSVDLISTTPSPVPLPAGALLMGTALAGFGMMRRRKKS